MKCSQCGYSYGDDSRFCPNCGAANEQPQAQQMDYQQGYQQQGGYQQGYQQQGGYQQGGYQQNFGGGGNGFKAPIKKRDLVVCILLSIFTCGIYSIIWYIQIVDDLNVACGDVNGQSGGMVFLLTLITCGIYGWYWMYKAGERVSVVRQRQGLPGNDSNGILYLVLSFLGLGIVAYCLIQSELNNVASY